MLDRLRENALLYCMNQLSTPKRAQIINLLVEGNSLRATSRIADVSINTVTKLLVEVGLACEKFHDETVKGISANRIQCDEIWSFVYAKEKNLTPELRVKGAGDIWTCTGIDCDTKLIISWFVGDRAANSALLFMQDVKSRIVNRPQLSTDGHYAYIEAIDKVFGAVVDYGQVVKTFGADTTNEKRYSPAVCIWSKKTVVSGDPDTSKISTSHVERQNLTMRMGMRRFTRLTNGFSKKVDNHTCAIALHFVCYNFARVHKTLRVTPAMEVGLTKRPMTIEEIVELTNQKISN